LSETRQRVFEAMRAAQDYYFENPI
jgi:hypothetical protein